MTYRQLQAALKYARLLGQIESTFRLNQKKEILQAKYNELQAATPAVKETQKTQPINIQSEIRRAYLQATQGELVVRVRIAAIRQALSHISRSDLDNALINMGSTRQVAFMDLDDPTEIKPADRDAVLMINSVSRYIMYLTA